jgi:hypothetical protein
LDADVLNNNGSLSLAGGLLEIFGGSSTGSFAVPSGSSLLTENYTFGAGTTVSGSGGVRLYGGTQTVNIPWTFGGSTVVSSGTTSFNQPVSAAVSVIGGTANFNAGGSGVISISSGSVNFGSPSNSPSFEAITVSGGTLNVNGALNVNKLSLQGGVSTVASAATLNVGSGTANFGRGNLLLNGLNLTLSADSSNPGRLLRTGDLISTASPTTSGILTTSLTAGQVPGLVDLGAATRNFYIFKGTSNSADLLVSAAVTNGGLLKDGTGTMQLSSPFNSGALSKIDSGMVKLAANETFNGAVSVSGGILGVSGSGGSLSSVSSFTLNVGGTLLLDDSSGSGGNGTLPRLSTTTAVNGRGGVLEVVGVDGLSSGESSGSLLIKSGSTLVDVLSGSGGTAILSLASLSRTVGASVTFEGGSLGSAQRILITGEASGFMGSWAHTLENGSSDFAAYDPVRGVIPLTQYTSGLAVPGSNGSASGVPEPAVGSVLGLITLMVRRRRESSVVRRR